MAFKKKLDLKNGIYSHEVKNKDTKNVTEFYKETPFPNYKDNDDKNTILQKGNRNLLAQQFKKFIGHKKKILEVGCGTGQLSIYFGIGSNNEIFALDPTVESLELAKKFVQNHNIQNVSLINVDIFDDVLADEYFDFIWCNGVLHHTKNPYLAFEILIKSLKKEGYCLIGLYNKIGRLRTIIRKYLFKIFGSKILDFLDPTLRKLKLDKDEKKAWIRDQYLHPIESLHTIDEVLKWFDKNNIEFISSIPSSNLSNSYQNIFEKKSTGSIYSRIISQISMLFNELGADGGLFIVIGKKS